MFNMGALLIALEAAQGSVTMLDIVQDNSLISRPESYRGELCMRVNRYDCRWTLAPTCIAEPKYEGLSLWTLFT